MMEAFLFDVSEVFTIMSGIPAQGKGLVAEERLRHIAMGLAECYRESPYMFLWRFHEMSALEMLRADGDDREEEGNVVDMGCGDGIFGHILFGDIRLGMDASLRGLRLARKRGYRSVALMRAERVPLLDSSVKRVLLNCVLEHIPDDQGVLREIRRVLISEGKLFITVPHTRMPAAMPIATLFGWGQWGKKLRQRFDSSLIHNHYYDEDTFSQKLEDAGFRIVALQPYLDATFGSEWFWWRLAQRRLINRRYVSRLFRLAARRTIKQYLDRALTGNWPTTPTRPLALAALVVPREK